MLKFIHPRSKENEDRRRLQKELFEFDKLIEHGFPHRPSAVAYDSELKLLAVGTQSGLIKVYGAPGVEFNGEHDDESAVTRMFFLPNQGRIISLLSDKNSFHLWEINSKDGKSYLEEKKHCFLEGGGGVKKVSSCCLPRNADHLLIGTEGGSIFLLDVNTFELTDHIIYQDAVINKVPENYKANPGAVECVAQHPTDENVFLIGYTRGLMVLWDNQKLEANLTYIGNQQLESICWHGNGTQFMTSHNDGSYAVWNTSDSSKPEVAASTPYGPFPCKAITKILWKQTKQEPYIIFSGGMQRASYGDKFTVTVMKGDKHEVLDFTSRCVDFVTLDGEDDGPHTLLVLLEEELVVLDLSSETWCPHRTPYLCSLHCSAITCSAHVTNVPESFWDKLVAAGDGQCVNSYSNKEWPITGGIPASTPGATQDILLTGHEDGSVRFWDASNVSLRLLYKLTTAEIFGEENCFASACDGEEEEWPPFRKVGYFDPYSDDPRLAIQRIHFSPLSSTLVVAGTAGQVVCFNMNSDEKDRQVEACEVNIVSERDSFVWKGHDKLNVKEGSLKCGAGFQPHQVLQIYPPAAISCLAVYHDWGLIAAGTAHGFCVYDFVQKKKVLEKCTLSLQDATGTSDTPMSRRKSLKKSLRESFRRIRKMRERRGDRKRKEAEDAEKAKTSEKPAEPGPSTSGEGDATEEKKKEEGDDGCEKKLEEKGEEKEVKEDKKVKESRRKSPTRGASADKDMKPVERQIEARGATSSSGDDGQGSMVRCLYFGRTFLIAGQGHMPTVWAGTNSGQVHVYSLVIPDNDKREEDAVQALPGKELQLRHRAPVVYICVLDSTNRPLPDQLEVSNERERPADMNNTHRVLVCSEEQFKVFQLPSLKNFHKHKLTAHDGSLVRKLSICKYRKRDDTVYSEYCLTCLTNQGDVGVYSLPHLRRQAPPSHTKEMHSLTKKEDISGISSCVFTHYGDGFYLISPNEMCRFSLSARPPVTVNCYVELPEGVRPSEPLEVEVKEEKKEEKGEVEEEKKEKKDQAKNEKKKEEKEEEKNEKREEEGKKEKEEERQTSEIGAGGEPEAPATTNGPSNSPPPSSSPVPSSPKIENETAKKEETGHQNGDADRRPEDESAVDESVAKQNESNINDSNEADITCGGDLTIDSITDHTKKLDVNNHTDGKVVTAE